MASSAARAGKGAEYRMSGYNEIGAMNFAEGFLLAGGQADILRKIIVKEYDLTRSAFANWVQKYNKTGSFKASYNRTEEEKDLIRLKKENQQLRMENDILKQAALILGQK